MRPVGNDEAEDLARSAIRPSGCPKFRSKAMKRTTRRHHAWRRLGAAALLICILDTPAGAGQWGVTPPSAPAVVTLPEAVGFLRIGSDERERLARRNEVPAWHMGTHRRFDRVALLAVETAHAHAFEADALEKLKETGRCIECDLSGAKLSGANLPGVNLSGADLKRASLTGADLSGANLSGANLSGANFHGVSLIRADLSGVSLISADLSGVDLSGADLSDANLGKAKLSSANLAHADLPRADLSGADLSQANLEGANLIRADLSGADLNGASLVGAEPIGADLKGANLERADLSGADLRFAVLTGTSLTGAMLHAANLDGAKGLTLGQLDRACGDAKTKLAPDLSVRSCP